MSKIEIIPARPLHCGPISRRRRAAEAEELDRRGARSHAILRSLLSRSYRAKTWMLDGRPVAIYGLIGSLLGSRDVIWITLTNDACLYWVELARQARAELRSILEGKDEVIATAILSDKTAVRFAKFMGFEEMPSPQSLLDEGIGLFRAVKKEAA